MSIRNANGLIVVQCDIPGCDEKWQTYSVRSIAREQARIHAGFTRESRSRSSPKPGKNRKRDR